VVVPAYKEEEYVEQTLRGIAESFHGAELSSEIIVVVDLVPGDETASHVRKATEMYSEIRVLERQGRRGVGDAIRAGIREASGKIVIPVMADQSEYPSDIVRLVRKAQHCDIVFTNRFKHGRPPGYPVLKYISNRCCNLAAMLLFRIPYSDTTNAFKAYTKALLDRIDLSSSGFEIFLEMPVKAMMLAPLRSDEIDVHHTVRKKRAAKLSVLKDGYRYACVLLSLLRQARGEEPHVK
jgi:glycosyltransferase involved in cell wall biosynthesis